MWKRAVGLTSVSSAAIACGTWRAPSSSAAGDGRGVMPTAPATTDVVEVDGRRILVCTPPSYENTRRRASFDVVYVLDCGHSLFDHVADAQRRCAAETRHKAGR